MDTNITKEENNNTEELVTDVKGNYRCYHFFQYNFIKFECLDQNFMAEMVEVRVKMYMCRICGIRYDNMESMKQHYNEEYDIFTLFWFQFCLIDLFFPSKKPSNIKC